MFLPLWGESLREGGRFANLRRFGKMEYRHPSVWTAQISSYPL
jgi:hypothetical protein